MSSPRPLSFESFRPALRRLWIRHRPRRWPGAEGIWTDWAHRSLGRPGRAGAALPDELGRAVDDVLYLPPVGAGLGPARDELARRWREAGAPLVVQRLVGEPDGLGESSASVWDLLPVLLAGDLGRLSELAPEAVSVWPLVAGLTDGDALVQDGLARLARSGVRTVQPMVLELSAAVRRQLAQDADENTFDRLFHGTPPSARRFCSAVVAHGLEPFIARPLPDGPPRLRVRRQCAGELRLAAELSHLLDRREVEAQTLLRSARWIDREDHDLRALAAESNLTIVDWFDATSRSVIEEVLDSGRSSLVTALEEEYTRPPEVSG